MIEIVREERNRLKEPHLQNLDVQIGINSGKIVAGIIGTKVVRYDIFGQDVLISALIMMRATPGSLLVSDTTRRMINRKQFIYDTMDWQENVSFCLADSDVEVQTFMCEQIFPDQFDSFSEENEMDQLGPSQIARQERDADAAEAPTPLKQ